MYVDYEMMETVCHPLTMDYLNTDYDPITDFEKHDKPLLESALGLSGQTYDGKDLYPTFVKKVAVLFYTLNKDHPFLNGNKRVSVMTLLVFISLNGKWLKVDFMEFVNITLKVANSLPDDRDELLEEIEEWLEKNVVKIK